MRLVVGLLAALLVLGVAAQLECRDPQPAVVKPEPFVRCDKAASCVYCSRNHWSLVDFTCCEDGNGWVSAHMYAPFIFYVFFQSPVWTMFAFTGFEAFEVLALLATGQFVIFQTTEIDLESWSGSMFGDVSQGFVGLWMAVMLTYVFDFPLLVSTRWHARKYGKVGRRARYVITWGLHALSSIALTWTNETDTLRYGLYTNMGVNALTFWLLYPFWLYSEREDRMIWMSPADGTSYPKRRRNAFFALCGLIILLVQLSNAGWHYLPSDWYQVWLTEAVIGTALTVWALVVAARRADWYMLVVFIGAFLLALALALLIVGILYDSVATKWAAAGVVLVGILALVINEFAQDRAQPYDVNYSRRRGTVDTLEQAMKRA